MGNSPIPYAPPPPPAKSNMSLIYYGLVVVGTAAVVLVVYNLIILRWCADRPEGRPRQGMAAPSRLEAGSTSSQSLDNINANLVSSFKYKKGGSPRDEAHYSQYECAVCLSVFEEDEELRQLPRCKHSFHASCIDMWLYSHLDCPLCRAPVDPPYLNRVLAVPARRQAGGHSVEGLLISRGIHV